MNSVLPPADASPTTPSTGTGPIAIIGMSGRFPDGANSPDLLWEKLMAGTDAVTEAKGDRWDLGWHNPDASRPGRVYTRAGGFLDRIDGFDAEFFGLSPREARQIDPQQRLLLELAWEAHEEAGIAPRSRAGSETGVFVGISSNDYARLSGPEWPDAYSNTGSSFSIAANRISYIFDFHGPSVAVDTACSSSLVCVHQACMSLLAGECSAALAGGISIVMEISPWLGFAKASMLSPTGRCKSFDASGDGYVRSEGGGLVLLKRLADAERDGDRILGVIIASGVNQDGRTMGLSMPNGAAQEILLRKVYAQCGVAPEDVFYVEAHGTGTAVGDPIECGALGRVLGAPRKDGSQCLIGSVKSNIGHLEAASGIAGLTKTLLALKYRQIPGNLHFNNPNPKIDFEQWKLSVVTEPTPLPERERPLVVGVNSFGFGGTNSHLVIREYRPAAAPAAATLDPVPQQPALLVLSAGSDAAVRDLAQSYLAVLRDESTASWAEICATAATTRTPLRCRLALWASTKAEAADRIERFLAGETIARLATGTATARVLPIAFVYSGNGPQWWGMGRELLAENALYREEIEAVDAVFAPLAGWSLMDEMRRPEAEQRIGLTEVAQPMLFAMQLGLTRILRASGIEASAVIGHSVGEVAAAWASGALSREQATRVIFHRSMEQAKTAGSGRMAALGVGSEEALAAMGDIPGWLELAALNAPRAVTVAGEAAAIEQLVATMTAAGKFARNLPLNYPFHTKAMEPIRAGLVDALQSLVPSASTIPFVSTVDGGEMAGESLDAEYWYRNIREPVRFSDGMAHILKERGIALFVEIGPHPVLKDYVVQAAKACEVAATALNTLRRPGPKGPEPESDNLWTAVAACHAHGAGDLERMFVKPPRRPALPLYPWQRVRHWRGAVTLPDTRCATAREHLLLGHRMPSADGVWENSLDSHLCGYLKDHVVQHAVVFPAAGYVEMSLAAARRTLGEGTLEIENFEVLRPLVIPANGDPLTQFSADAKDGTFEIRSRPDLQTADWTAHVRGRLSRSEAGRAGAPRDIAAIAARMAHAVSAEEHYRDASVRGLDYGAAFQGVREVRLTEPTASPREALADIGLDMLEGDPLVGYLAHPALLDSCIQVLVALIAQNEKRPVSTIPVQIARVRSHAPLVSRMVCHTVMRSESARSAVADFQLMDTSGNLLMTIEGARCQKVDFNHAGATPLISDWWRPDPQAVAAGTPAPLPVPAATAGAMTNELETIQSDTARADFYRKVRPGLRRLIGAYAAQALAVLHPGEGGFDLARLGRKGGVTRAGARLLAKLVTIAEQDELLTNENGLWHWNAARPRASADGIWRELFREHPRYHVELQLLAQLGDRLVDRLRGDDDSDASALLDQLLDTSPFQAPYHRIVRGTLEKIVAAWPADRPIRILEIAGAGGGMAAWILPVLPAQRTDYVFSDPSEAAIGRAEHRLAAHRYVRFEVLDLTRDLVEQGQPAGYFDIVIGTHALDATDDGLELLRRLKAVMAADGQLLLVQTGEDRFADLVLGVSAAPCAETLAEGGFGRPAVLNDAGACLPGELPQQSVYLAQRIASSDVPVLTNDGDGASRWMLVFERDDASSEFGSSLVRALEARGQTVAVHAFAGGQEDLKLAISEALECDLADEVVFVSGRADVSTDLLATQTQRCMTALCLTQAIEAVRQEMPCSLTFVTRGAFSTAGGDGPTDPGQAPLWGLGRVIGNEHAGLDIRLVDLHAEHADEASASWLAAELLRRDAETEVQLVAGRRFVNRQRMNTMTDEARFAGSRVERFALDFAPQGGLDSLYLRAALATEPGPNDVEIEVAAAGLNFRDVLWAMGMLPEEAVEHGFSGPTIGMECSGTVSRVGTRVAAFKPGDRVVAFASDCFGSHVVTDAGAVAHLPEGIELAAAATIPTAFLTAWYGLDYLARLEPGETVLIHGAAGGVGLAAIQIAKMKGAKVIGTAGSVRKRRMLELLGVDHALNSRSLEFADQVMALTGGVGVDVVLNSLAGEAITKSLQCLRPFGRFLEIGKRDLYANSRIGLRPFRNNLSYFGIDADTLLIERSQLARSMFKALMEHFASGALKPLPFQEIPVSRAAEAFRAMQQSRHIGKLVVSMRCDRNDVLPVVRDSGAVRPGATYLITGGLGGFGLATAVWLAEQGATSLALLGRRGAVTEEAIAGVAHIERLGASVRSFAVDIADADALTSALATVRAEMPPLVGIVHSAALIEDAPILNLDGAQVQRVFAPKLLGAWNLHQATLRDPIEMFITYSSSSAVVGNPGQGAYVAANLYLDSLAEFRRSLGLPALSIGWGAIKDAGFLTRHAAVAGMLRTRTGLDATPARDALADLGRLQAVGATRVSVARFDLQRLGQMLPGARVPRFLPIIPKGAAAMLQAEESLATLVERTPAADRRALVLAHVREHGARVLGTSASQIDVDKPLAELGLDSLMAVELASGLERSLGQPVSVMQMLGAGSLTAIAEIAMKILGIDASGSVTTATTDTTQKQSA